MKKTGTRIHGFMRTFAFATILATLAASASAKPARRGPINVEQPDGTQLTIRLAGDEYGHLTYSEDGYPLVYDDALGYVYANVNSDGTLTATSIKANNIASRTAAERNFVAGISNEKIDLAKNAVQTRANARKATRANSPKKGPGLCTSTYPLTGKQKGLVILVEFSDVKFGSSNGSSFSYDSYSTGGAHQYFSDELNKEGFNGSGAIGSARDWFLENSIDENGNSQFEPEFDLYGPVTLPNLMAWYGGNDSYGNDRRPHMMAVHACQLLDDEVDFSQYDRDGDGYVDNIYIFYAGFGEADGGSKNTIWPHSWDISSAGETNITVDFDGVKIDHYACSNETDYTYKRPDGIGTFVHEFSHVMGLPDLYCTNYGNSYTPGSFSVMDYGPYNGEGCIPPNYSSYERYALGWLTPKEFGKEQTYTISNLADTNDSYIVNTEKDTEWFLVENRQQSRWDSEIPGHGMLIWHIDYVKKVFDGNTVNNTASHQYVDLIEANGRRSSNYAAGHPFPGTSNVTSYTFSSWNSRETGVTFSDITEEDGLINVYAVNTNYQEDTNAVQEIGVDSNAKAEYYNLQGIRVLNPEKGQLLIKRSGSNVTKIIF